MSTLQSSLRGALCIVFTHVETHAISWFRAYELHLWLTRRIPIVARILDHYWSMLVQPWIIIIILVQYYTNIGQLFFATRHISR
jgi:hypothetical protein